MRKTNSPTGPLPLLQAIGLVEGLELRNLLLTVSRIYGASVVVTEFKEDKQKKKAAPKVQQSLF